MTRRRINLRGGMQTDDMEAPGLLLLSDGYEERGGIIRKRGGKTAWSSSYLTDADDSYAHAYIPNMGSIASAHVTGEGSLYHLIARGEGGASFSDLGSTIPSFGASGTHSTFSLPFYSISRVDVDVLLSSVGGDVMKWGGSRKAAYGTGTVTIASTTTTTITGSGTSWSSNVEAGMYIRINNATISARYFRITAVNSNTSIDVDVAPGVSIGAGVTYVIVPVGVVCTSGSAHPLGTYPNVNGGVVGHQGRAFLLGTNETVWQYERVRYSAAPADTASSFRVGVDNYDEDSYFDAAPGIGGSLRGGLSVGNNEMLMFKENALLALRGAVEQGNPTTAQVDIISPHIGCRSRVGFANTPIGVVFANRDGVWVYDGSQVRSLTNGRVARFYEDNVITTSDSPTVSCIGPRIVVQWNDCLVFDIEQDSWSRQVPPCVYGPIVRSYDANGALDADLGLDALGDQADDWQGDLSTDNKNDPGVTDRPRLEIRTKPVDITDGELNGRISHVYVDGYVQDAASDNPSLDVSLYTGRSVTGVGTGLETIVSVGDVPEGTYDRVHRLPKVKMPPARQALIRVLQENAASDARIVGLEVESGPVRRTR